GFLRKEAKDTDLRPLAWDDGPPWEFHLEIVPDASGKNYLVTGGLHRGGERMPLAQPVLLTAGGLMFWQDRATRLEDFGAFDWISLLRRVGQLTVPRKQKD